MVKIIDPGPSHSGFIPLEINLFWHFSSIQVSFYLTLSPCTCYCLLSSAKTQVCRSGKLLRGRPSKDFGNFEKDFCGISGPARIRKHWIARRNYSCTISNNLPPPFHSQAFLALHISFPSSNTGFYSQNFDSSDKVQMSC